MRKISKNLSSSTTPFFPPGTTEVYLGKNKKSPQEEIFGPSMQAPFKNPSTWHSPEKISGWIATQFHKANSNPLGSKNNIPGQKSRIISMKSKLVETIFLRIIRVCSLPCHPLRSFPLEPRRPSARGFWPRGLKHPWSEG